MEKRIIWLAVSLIIFVFSPAHAGTLTVEYETDRPGCDYQTFVLPGIQHGNYNPCMDACGLDFNCEAWNFDPRSGTPTCFLKNCVPAATASSSHPLVTSGVKFPQ